MKLMNTIIPISPARSGLKLKDFLGVTIHETGNFNASADSKNHAVYLNGIGNQKQVSYHYAVDESLVYHLIPDNEVAWHAGDGINGIGNTRTIAIEICVNSAFNSPQRLKAIENAASIAAKVLKEHNLTACAGHLFQHHDFSPYGKNCPTDLRAGRPVNWEEFCRMVDEFLAPSANDNITDEREPCADKLYRIQVGAFKSRENAEKYMAELKQQGVIGFIREEV